MIAKEERSRLRIAFCIDSFDVGGTELNAVRTAESLGRESFELSVFHMKPDGPLRARYDALAFPMERVRISNLYSPDTLREGWRLAGLLRRGRFDVVHTHDVYTNILFAPWARAATGAGVITSRRWSGALPRAGLAHANAIAHRLSHWVLANSPSVARLLQTEGIPAERICEVPNFLDDEAFVAEDPRGDSEWRAAHGVPTDAFVVGSVARLVPVKNHGMLLAALSKLPDDFHAMLVGDGPSRSMLEARSRELGLTSRVHFLGTLLGSGNLHRRFDVSVLCSDDEGFPNAIIEAFAASKAVVATDVGGVSDVVVDGVNGILVPRRDPDALAAAISELRSNVSMRRGFGQSGRNIVKERHSRGAVIERLSRLYGRAAAWRSALKSEVQTA